ncbi:MAG: NADH-quinone oxidoreductase subunit C [Lentisphaerota bacterium]
MFETQEIINIKKEELLPKVSSLLKDGQRLVQICCTKGSKLVVDYSFDKNYKFTNFRLELDLQGDTLPSITEVYFAAFTYENELHDLFGINVVGNKLDFGGKFYRIKETAPFNKPPCQEVKNA